MGQRLRGMGRLRTLAIVVLLSSLASAGIVPYLAHADGRTDYLVRLLRTSDAFRVRAQPINGLLPGVALPFIVAVWATRGTGGLRP